MSEMMKIIDVHLHYRPGSEENDPEILVNSGVISGGWMLSLNGMLKGQATDEEVLRLCKRYEDFFVPFGYLDLETEPARIEEQKARGFVGLKAIWPSKPYDDERHFPFYEVAARLGMPILFHVGGGYYVPAERRNIPTERTLGRNMLPGQLDAIAKTFPDLVIIGAHMGGCAHYFDEAMVIAYGHPNIYLDISSDLVIREVQKVKEAVNFLGPDKLLFGSDAGYCKSIECAHFWKVYLEQAFLHDRSVCEKIMGANAERIIGESGGSR